MSGAELTLQECLKLRSPSLVRAHPPAQLPARKFCAACKGGAVPIEGKVWGWQGHGGDAGEQEGAAWVQDPHALDAPSPGALWLEEFPAAQM